MKRNIALVAHDNKKADLVEWCDYNKGTLSLYNLYATGGTGIKIMEKTGLNINLLKDGSHGGDMEIAKSTIQKATPPATVSLYSFLENSCDVCRLARSVVGFSMVV